MRAPLKSEEIHLKSSVKNKTIKTTEIDMQNNENTKP